MVLGILFLGEVQVQFCRLRGITEATSYDLIDELMQQQKDDTYRSKAKKRKKMKRKTHTKRATAIEIGRAHV